MKASGIRYSTCEKDFVLKAIRNGIRLDGRQYFDYRHINIQFGLDYGCCEVQLGETRVIAQVSSELKKPTNSRPTEGQLYFNVDLSPMASPAFEAGRSTDQSLEMNRLVERCLKESRPIDVESLCLVAGEMVWAIRVDITILNNSGNILDCACIAGISALAHFKRNDVTVSGNDVKVHGFKEKEPVPLNVFHMPVSCTFGFLSDEQQMIIDPDEKEETILSGKLMMASNIYGEICCAQMNGGVSLDCEQIMQCAKIATIKATEITELIKESLEEDKMKRLPPSVNKRPALKDPPQIITKTTAQPSSIDTSMLTEVEDIVVDASCTATVEQLDGNTVAVGGGGANTWLMSDGSDSDGVVQEERSVVSPETIVVKNDSGASEEDDVLIVHQSQLEGQNMSLEHDVTPANNNNEKSVKKKKRKKKKKTE